MPLSYPCTCWLLEYTIFLSSLSNLGHPSGCSPHVSFHSKLASTPLDALQTFIQFNMNSFIAILLSLVFGPQQSERESSFSTITPLGALPNINPRKKLQELQQVLEVTLAAVTGTCSSLLQLKAGEQKAHGSRNTMYLLQIHRF